MKLRSRHPQKGSLVLVVLCFVAVLGIGLAGYLAISGQSMRLSNRSYVGGVGKQLAEMGLEQSLWAFNRNDWSAWTIAGTTATRTTTFPNTKFGSSGLATTVRVRVDNYNAYNLGATWSSTTTYQVNDLVGENGTWYRCVKNGNLNQDPSLQTDLTWWVPAPIPWMWNRDYAYSPGDVVNYSGAWYRCNLANTSVQPPNVPYWISIPTLALSWNPGTIYASGSYVYRSGTWYRCVTPNINQAPPNINWSSAAPYISWSWRSAVAYNFNDLVYSGGNWYRCVLGHTNHVPPNTTFWENALSDSWAWASTTAYNLNDVVYSGSSFYRCILAHTNHAPPNATYWSNAPLRSTVWDPGKQYAVNDTATYDGVWYRCRATHNGHTPPTTSPYYDTYWTSTADTSRQWISSTTYNIGDTCSYGGVWYNCAVANTNQPPTNATDWTAMGAPVVYAEGAVTLPDGSRIKTQLRATIAPAPLFPNALGAASTISVGGGGTVDSYDSGAGPYAGQVGTTTNYSAVVAAGNTGGTAVTLGSTAVKGYVAVPSNPSSPYAPLFSSGGSVKGYTSPGSPNIDPYRVSRSPYVPRFDPLPAGGLSASWSTVPTGTALVLGATTNIGTPGATTPSRYYYNSDLALTTTAPTILNINGPVILYINGDLLLDGDGGASNGLINITSPGAAEIHVAGSLNVNIDSFGISNLTTDPKKLILICDTAASSAQNYSDGTNLFYGVIYVPNTTSASGLVVDNNAVQIFGAVSARKITYSGVDANVHFDSSLRSATFGGVEQPYVITEWRELTDATEKITLP